MFFLLRLSLLLDASNRLRFFVNNNCCFFVFCKLVIFGYPPEGNNDDDDDDDDEDDFRLDSTSLRLGSFDSNAGSPVLILMRFV